jgi:hypothetical protein
MATLDELRLEQLLRPFNDQTGIVGTNQALPMINNNPFINVTDQLMQFDPNNQNKSIVDQIIAENQMKASQNFIGSPFLNVPRGTETISPNTGIPGVVEPDGSFRVIPGYINRSNNIYMGDAASAKPNKIDLSNLINMGVANEPDEEQVEYLTEQEPSGIAKLLEFLGKLPTPFNLAKRGLESLRGLNQKIRSTDFAQSKTLYFDARRYGGRDARDRAASQTMREARAIQQQVDRRGDSTSRIADRNRSSVTTSSAAKSKGVGGGGYTKSDSTRESYRGRY